jgi:TonB family protein
MIAAWMLYCVAIGLVLTVVGVALERGLHLAGRPTRWAWIAALTGSFLIPTAAWLRPDAFSTLAVPFPTAPVSDAANVVAPVRPDAQTMANPATSAFSLRDLDVVLRWGWTASSILLLCVFGAAALRLAALRRRWRASLVDGRRVLVSDNVGPAVAGLWRPVVIVPAWALALGQAQQRLMLSHEEEHLRAADPWLLAFGAAALVLMPWNPALWWQVRRLRLAVEIDCDARVLARGGTAPEYGELLLRVGHRRTQFALAAPALGEPVSFLERRIRRMATTLPRWRWAGAAVAVTVAAGALVGACEAPRPVQPEQSSDRAAAAVRTPESLVFMPVLPLTQEDVPSRDVMIRWMRAAIAREYPDYLTTPAKPSVDLWFHGTTGGRVIRSTRNVRGGVASVGYKEVRAQLPEVGPMRPGMWFGWAYPLGPGREDARAIWVYGSSAESDSVSPPEHRQTSDHEQPELLSGPRLQYPDLLRYAGIQGRVIVQAMINETGRAETASVKIVESPHPGFNQAAKDWVLAARFDPARVQGRAVRRVVNVPVEFAIE